ncbi:siderophore-interacting protein [Saccharopolyspora taberi]|uniref:Siderophore-interacting protein n=1 Tax=Saccharopolyspora taberi TaxID=60895 RepID=A0ABN3VA52_9PSEU
MSSSSGVRSRAQVRPYGLFLAEVVAVREITPNMVRISLGGPGLTGITSGGYDQRIKVLLPLPGQTEPAMPDAESWFESYRAMDETSRPVMRTYTIRAHRPHTNEIDVDFVLHGDVGPASRWARRAVPGDVIGIVGPNEGRATDSGVEYRPRAADWQLIVGDETALPAIASIVESLPPGALARVFVEVPTGADVQRIDTAGSAEITWLPRTGHGSRLPASVRAAELPGGTPYAWVAGEAAMIRELRRHLVGERGWDKERSYFGGYWRRGMAEGAR